MQNKWQSEQIINSRLRMELVGADCGWEERKKEEEIESGNDGGERRSKNIGQKSSKDY